MNIIDVQQGSDEWLALRANYFTASEAPASLGLSKYQKRVELLHQKQTGIVPPVDARKQALFDRGHDTEASARPHAEKIVGAKLYPVTATLEVDGLPLLASLDGARMDEEEITEHKLWSESLAEDVRNGTLAPHYTVQMDQQLLVSGAKRCLFMVSDGTPERMVWCWYETTPEKIAALIQGWKQFDLDLSAYEPPAAAEPVLAKKIDTLPALRVDVTGMVTASNLDEFKTVALGAIRAVNRDLKTDQDFADAAEAVKWCADVESRLKAAKEHILGQTGSIDAALKVMDDIADEARRTRLDVDKIVTNRKEQIRADIITKARGEFKKHTDELQAEIKGATLACVIPDFTQAAKGKRTVDTMQDAVDTLMAQAKIGANVAAKVLRDGLACISENGAGYEFLFADRAGLAGKPLDDLRVMVKARIDEHIRAEQAREVARKADEDARIDEQQRQQAAAEARAMASAAVGVVAAPGQYPAPVAATAPAPSVVTPPITAAPPAAHEAATLNIGAINARLAVMKIDAAGMASLGIEPADLQKAAKLYTESQFRLLCMRLQLTLGKLLRDEVAA